MGSIAQAPRPRRRPVGLAVLTVVAALGLLAFLRSPGYREYRLRRMSEPALRAWTASHPHDPRGHFYLGLALGRGGDTRAAAGELRKALDLDPALSRARWRLARVLATTRQEREAETLLQQGLQLDPAAAQLHAELGRLYERRQDLRRAAAAWEKAVSLAPSSADAWYRLGQCWMGVNNEARAVEAYRRAVDLAPRSATHHKALAGVLRLRREYGEAERHYRRALELDAADPDAHFGLAKLLWDQHGPTSRAEASLRRAVTLQPDSPLLHYSLASLYQQRGHLQAAVREYQMTLRLLSAREPSPTPERWDEREQWLSRMEGPHFNLARVLQRLGRSEEAARHLAWFRRISDYRNRAHQLLIRLANRPGDAVLHFDLARTHAAAGATQLAEEQYHAGLRLRPDPQARAELLALRRSGSRSRP
jgi:tetratricopeptide (TPR) repeat protein